MTSLKSSKPTQHERYLVKLARRRYREKNYERFRSWLRGFRNKRASDRPILKRKFDKMLREKADEDRVLRERERR